jgi:methionyl-tRNA formyltransferase/ubiquinone/menaquinone biosynthesis C-methylase UbiE
MRLVFLTTETPHHFYLINEINKFHPVTKVFFQTKQLHKSSRLKKLSYLLSPKKFRIILRKIMYKSIFGRLDRMQENYERKMFFGVKENFLNSNIPYEKVNTFNERNAVNKVREVAPDLIIVFGTEILKGSILNIAKLGIVNIHRAILPEYRGADHNWWIFFNKDFDYLGCTIHYCVDKIDAGDIIAKRQYRLSGDDEIFTLRYKTTIVAVELLKDVISQFKKGNVHSEKQSYTKLWLAKNMTLFKRIIGYINFRRHMKYNIRSSRDKCYRNPDDTVSQKKRVRKAFQDSAKEYSQEREQRYSFLTQKKDVLDLIDGTAGTILDIGCGGGYMEPDLLSKGFKVYAVDISEEMLSLAKKRIKKEDFDSNSYFLVSDIEHLPFIDSFLDAIICMGVIEYLSSCRLALKEMHRVLKPNGAAIITTPSKISPHCFIHSLVSFIYRHIKRVFKFNLREDNKVARYKVRYVIPWRFEKLITRFGFKKVESRYCNFIFYPLDKLFPSFSISLSKKLERLSCSKRWGWLGRQYIIKMVKRGY